MNPRAIRFVHRGALVEVHDAPITRSVLNWLREDARCTGTKEGCNEGDCGACTVMVGALVGGPGPDRLRWRTVNACLQFLPSLDGKALRTVEDLPADHPAPRAMVECHGSQCGFCTPGFVVSLAACLARHRSDGTRPARRELADALAGNLCRCTGYRPILDAGEAMFDAASDAAAEAPDDPATLALLRRLAADPPLHYAARNPATGSVETLYAPRTVDELAALAAARPEATLLAGCTDIGLWVNKQFRVLPEIIYVGAVAEMKRIDADADGLHIGAGAALEDAWAALAAHVPALREMGLRFASPPVRHAGTMGGNLANGSPIGDGAPVLMALGASLQLRHGAAERVVALDEFYLGYMKSRRAPGEVIVGIDLPWPDAATQVRAYKLSKRRDCDISGLACGLAVTLDGATVRAARFAFGGLAGTVSRARQAEAAVLGQPWTEATARAAMAALAQDFQPLTDLRGSAGYRRRSAQALLQRFWLETRPDDPLPASATQVWSHA
jgi:xanthine dehydrogenase small subunit